MNFSFKQLLLIFSLLITSIILTACNGNKNKQQGYELPDLTGKTKVEYKQFLNSPLITIVEKTENHNTIPVDQFIRYGDNLVAGNLVIPGKMVYVYFSDGPKVPVVNDTEAPQIIGADDVEIPFSSEFDPLAGITIIDNVDSNLSDRLIVSGIVDTYEFDEQTIIYSIMDKSGNLSQVTRKITIIPSEIDTRYTDELTLDASYEGKSFINDGIGIVTFVSKTDGDTAKFRDIKTGETFALRFLGIDTPESTPMGGFDPWGDEASEFTTEKLENANLIVLEGEGLRFEGYGRYLGWVWIDGRLLNLEIVEYAYSTAKGSSDSKYFEIFLEAERKASGTKKRIWGELDPDYNY
ncbi:MAG: nucH [Haloplasmataceae bacterium]|jgi:endonuclease YncB( thermonuclease family)|nr:nucH [Haloplasmataceae bacterium]